MYARSITWTTIGLLLIALAATTHAHVPPAPTPACDDEQNPHEYIAPASFVRGEGLGTPPANWMTPILIDGSNGCDTDREFGIGGGTFSSDHHGAPFAVGSIKTRGAWLLGSNLGGSHLISPLEGDCLQGPFPTFKETLFAASPSASDYYGSCPAGTGSDPGNPSWTGWVVFVACTADAGGIPDPFPRAGCATAGHIWSSAPS